MRPQAYDSTGLLFNQVSLTPCHSGILYMMDNDGQYP